jgi:hypothetical protein
MSRQRPHGTGGQGARFCQRAARSIFEHRKQAQYPIQNLLKVRLEDAHTNHQYASGGDRAAPE